MNIKEIRAKYPQYDDLSDAELVNGFHSKFYSDIPIKEFQNKIGFNPTAPAPTEKPAEFSAKETALAFGQGVVGVGKSITDVFGAENVASQALGKVQTTLGEQFSPERKAEMARREAIQKKAAESGSLVEEISAFLGSVADAPVQSLAQGLGSIVPYVGTGIIGAIARLGGPAVMAINTVLGTAQGAGAVKGSIYDGVRNELINTGMDPREAEAKASKAQEYLGGNLLDIIGGAALGGIGARVGVEKLLTPGAAAKLDAGLLGRAGKAALAEAPLEGAQAGQEQVAVNRALQQAGFDVDTFKGAAGAAARDAVIGALTGAAVGSVRGPGIAPAPPTPPLEEGEAPPPVTPPVTPPGGIPPEALDLETLLGTGAPAAGETVDFETPTSGKSIAELEESIATRQTQLDNGTHPNPKAAVNTQANEIAELNALKAKGEQDAIQQTDRGTSGDGTELPGGPPTTGAATGVAGAGRPGVVSDQSAELASQDGARSEQSALADQEAKAAAAAEQAALNEEAAAELAGKAVTPPKATRVTKAKKETVTAPSDYLSSRTFYGDKSPTEIVNERTANPKNKLDTDPVNIGINNAGHEEAFDAYDTVDIKTGVNPKLKDLAEARNKEQEAKRQQMRQELSGKIDPETGKKYSKKRITALVSNIPLYDAGAPLDFLTEDQLVEIYKNNANKRGFIKGESTTRSAQQQSRLQFVEGLEELQKAKVQAIAQRSFADEVISNARRKTQTTAADKRKARANKLSKTAEELSQELQAIAKEDTAIRETEAKQVAEQEAIEAAEEKATLEVPLEKEKEAKAKKPPKEKPAPTKSKLVTKLESAIVDNDVDAALDVIGTDRINERGTRTIAQSFLKLVNNFGGVTIQFNDLPEGEDGLFDPATNTIALKGKDGVYTGKRPIDETVMHEVGHYLTDHVFDNREAYLKSIKDPAKRKEVENALNRLDNNYRFVKGKLGDKFNIPTMKEFIAEIFGNPKFQVAVANLDPYKTPERVEGFTGPRKQFRKFEGGMLQTIVRNIANALGFSSDLEGVTFKEILDDVFKIVSLPTANLRGAEVSYAKAAQPKAPLTEPSSVVEKKLREDEAVIPPENSAYNPRKVESKDFKYFKRLLFTKAGWKDIANALQYNRYAIKDWEDKYSLAGKIIREGKNTINNIHEQITLATGRGKNLYNSKVEGIYKELNEGILGLSKALGKGTDVALDMAHRVLEATHEPERRLVKYLMAVPLSTTAKVTLGKESISAADYRDRIFNALDTKSFTEAQAKELRKALEAVVFTTDANGNRVPNTKYVDPLGRSPAQVTQKDGKIVGVDPDINSLTYNVTGLSLESNANRLVNYKNEVKNNPELKKHMDLIIASIKKLHDVTTELNKQANYWSQPVTNRVNFYGWKHYVPLKGVSKVNQADEMLDLDGDAMGREVGDITPSNKGKGKELQEITYGLDGRISVSDNPVLQSLSDAVRAAGRAGRKDLTQAIKNSVAKGQFNPYGQGILPGKVLMNVKFEQRSDPNFLKELPRENTIFHYNEDGSFDVIEISNKKLREAIRRTYKDTNSLVNYANNITSFLGQVHTRYNYNFAPLNFVRDALTNAWTLGAEMGPKKSAEFIAAISGNVINKGAFGKAAKIAYLYQQNNTKEIQRLAKADPFVKEMVEFIEEGGMVEYIQGLSLKSNFERLQKEVGSSMVIRNVRQLNKLIDIWTDMFEITSRASAYSIAKKNFLEEGLSETAARTKAAAYSKNLANFEQVGEHGRGLGALFMFFRPSATGAVRAIEAALPAFQKLEKGSFGFGNPVMNELPPNLTDAEKATYKKNFSKRQKASRYMLTYLMSLGALSYTMAMMMADEDDLGRNKLMKDDMGQWTRFLRFHTPFSDKPFQIPWGFGLGSFMASGAQLAAVASGQQSIGSALGNIATQISLDSFVPIPFSRMKIEDNPALFMIDSITPSMLRPAVQFVVNKNGLGQDIYNDSNRRMGSAYLGGDNIPQTYKVLATTILDTFGIDVSPNSLYFLANSYVDGPARVVDLFVNSTNLAMDQKEFNAKTDIPFIGSFIGAAPNVDGREFNSITEQVEKMAGRMNMLEKANPDEYLKYLDKNPLHEEIVEFFDKNIGELNKLRKETNEARIEPGMSPKERTQLIRELNQEQNLIKYDLIQQFKAYYNLKP
jgi:hypothetical protein